MRAFLNAILAFIGSESLTDQEFDAIPESLEQAYTEDVYDALKAVLTERESVSGQLKKLKLYFIARGVEFSSTQKAVTPRSEILVGGALD